MGLISRVSSRTYRNMYDKILSILFITAISVVYSHGGHGHEHSPLEADGAEHHKDDLGTSAGKDPKDMTPDELQFYYFKQHDFDNNDKLDGNELIASMVQYEKM